MKVETHIVTGLSTLLRNDEYYRKIGQVICVWSDIEALMDAIAWRILKVNERIGTCVTAQFGTQQKIYAFCALAREVCAPEDDQEITSIAKELETHRAERNRIVHGMWILGLIRDSTPTRRTASARGRLKDEKPLEVELEFLSHLQSNMIDTQERIAIFFRDRIIPRLA